MNYFIQNMTNHLITKITVIILSIVMVSCSDWLGEPQPGKSGLNDYFIAGGGAVAIQATNAVYVPLQWEFGQNYCCEWFIGDVASDDALKGGQNTSDIPAAYEIDNFKISSNNALLLDWYQLNFHGVARANFVLEQIPLIEIDATMDESVKNRLLGEAYFLRALYYFRLVRVFEEIPLVTEVISGSEKWKQPKATVEVIYTQIFSDLETANQKLWTVDRLPDSDIGRATKGAAQAMLLKTHLYYAQFDNSHYATAKQWGDSIIESGKYELEAKYADNFSIDNENGKESVFEVQYGEEATSDYGDFGSLPHFGATRGTFTTVLTRSRSTEFPSSLLGGVAEGWGFNKPTEDLHKEFEQGDLRREVSILNLDTGLMTNTNEEFYLGTPYLSRKYALMDSNDVAVWKAHNTRSPINIKLIRYADALLMYAEAANESGDFAMAKATLNQLRRVRRAETTDPATQLPDFPNYVNRKTGINFTDDHAGLREAIRHERRVELAMESHRWFDLVRWGIAVETMNEYRENETSEVQKEMAIFEEKNNYFPLPQYEIDLSGFEQNGKWK
ncbi:MAG: RagB/SusD family nutrient uptake outer membrane protein [Puniceicoccales bacterium]|jgi:hypothetical protein|nr:RagB/SusD family nutrient uptake outer membrane protein [Puniceicoccales bacterium]